MAKIYVLKYIPKYVKKNYFNQSIFCPFFVSFEIYKEFDSKTQ